MSGAAGRVRKKRIYYSAPIELGMSRKTEPICGAQAASGAVCQITHGLNQSGRCRLHAGPERMCGALTMNGTLCRNPNIGTLGLCPAHSSITTDESGDAVMPTAPAEGFQRECGALTSMGTYCRIPYLTALGRCSYHSSMMKFSAVRANSSSAAAHNTDTDSGLHLGTVLGPRTTTEASIGYKAVSGVGVGASRGIDACANTDAGVVVGALQVKSARSEADPENAARQNMVEGSGSGASAGTHVSLKGESIRAKLLGTTVKSETGIDRCSTDSGLGTAIFKSGSTDGSAMDDTAMDVDSARADVTDAVAGSSSSGASRVVGTDMYQVTAKFEAEGKTAKRSVRPNANSHVNNIVGDMETKTVGDLEVSSPEESSYICGAPTTKGSVCRSLNLTSLGWCAAHSAQRESAVKAGAVKGQFGRKHAPVCGVMTQRGKPCRNPYLTPSGFCAYHSTQRTGAPVPVGVEAAPNSVAHRDNDASPAQNVVAVLSTSTTAHIALSASACTADERKNMGSTTGIGVGDVKVLTNKESARVCGACTQKGTACRDTNLTQFGLCALHTSKIYSSGANAGPGVPGVARVGDTVGAKKDKRMGGPYVTRKMVPLQLCGALTKKGTSCRSPFLTRYLLCPSHTFQLKGKRAGPGVNPSSGTSFSADASIVSCVGAARSAAFGTCALEKAHSRLDPATPTGSDTPRLHPSMTGVAARLCGATTAKGTLCENPYLTEFGLCSAHTAKMKLAEPDTISSMGRARKSANDSTVASGANTAEARCLSTNLGSSVTPVVGVVGVTSGASDGNGGTVVFHGRNPVVMDAEKSIDNGNTHLRQSMCKRRVCGARTAKGSSCQNPKVSRHFGVCSAHIAQSKQKQGNTGGRMLRESGKYTSNVDGDSQVKREHPHMCGARTQNGMTCRNPNFMRNSRCPLHAVRGKAESSSAVANSSAETVVGKECKTMSDVEETRKLEHEDKGPVEVLAMSKRIKKDRGGQRCGRSDKGVDDDGDKYMADMRNADFEEAGGVDARKKRKIEVEVKTRKRARVEYHSPVKKESISLELGRPEPSSPSSAEQPADTRSQEEQESLRSSFVELVRNNFSMNAVRRVFGYLRSKVPGSEST